MKFILLVGISFIFVLSILYEISKTINNAAMVFIFVSLGYPLRFFIGLYAFAPELLSSNLSLNLYLFLLFIAIALYGEFSAIIPWTLESIELMKKQKMIKKDHYNCLFNVVKDRFENYYHHKSCKLIGDILEEKGTINDPWNLCLLGALVFLFFGIFIIDIPIEFKIIEVVLMIGLISLCYLFDLPKFILEVLVVLLVIKVFDSYTFDDKLYFITSARQTFFVATYLMLRYFFNPDFNFMVVVIQTFKTIFLLIKNFVLKLFCVFVGEEAFEYIKSHKKARNDEFR